MGYFYARSRKSPLTLVCLDYSLIRPSLSVIQRPPFPYFELRSIVELEGNMGDFRGFLGT